MRVMTDDGQTIHYELAEGDRPVLLIHGFGSSGLVAWEGTGWLRALAEEGRGAVVVDLRGHGASSKPGDPESYSPDILAADLIAVLDDAGIDRIDVLGYSMGSQVARRLAVLWPERVGRLVLGGGGGSEQFSRMGVASIHAALHEGAHLDDPVMNAILTSARELPAEDRRAIGACAEGMASHPIEGTPAAPTLVIAGDADLVAHDASHFARVLGALHVVVPGRHHGNTLTARAFKRAALDFLG